MPKSYGVVIFEYNGEYFYHSVKAENYENCINSLPGFRVNFKAGKNNIDEGMANAYILKARRLVSRSMYGTDDGFFKELKRFED